jgi:hypothetical protein
MTVRHAACSCGKLAVVVRGEPVRISVCPTTSITSSEL